MVFHLGFPCLGQDVQGVVLDAGDRQPLQGAIIRTTDSNGKTLGYRMADKDGRFTINVSGADSIKISLLGYEEQAYGKPFDRDYSILMKASVRQIEKSIVSARKVEMAGDTIRYNVNALRIREDRVLSDILKRIPGLEVSEGGFIRYNGRSINKLYVDGRDILENSYNLATKNLSAESVQSIEILENHQPVRLFEGLQSSDKAALNIVLDKNSKNNLYGGLSSDLGVAGTEPKLPLAAKFSSFYMPRVLSSVNIAGYDSQGNSIKERELSDISDRAVDHYDVRKRLIPPISSAPLEDKRSVFNKTMDFSSVEKISIGKSSSLGFTGKFIKENYSSSKENRSEYDDSGETIVIDRSEYASSINKQAKGIVTFSENNSRKYIVDKIYSDISSENGSILATGRLNSSQKSISNTWNVENDCTWGLRTGNKAFVIKSLTQFSGVKEQLSLNDNSIHQSLASSVFFQNLYASGLSRTNGRWSSALTPEASMTFYQRHSLLEGIDEDQIPGIREGRNDVEYLKAGASGSIQYKGTPFEAALNGTLYYSCLRIDRTSTQKVIGNISARLKYITGRWEASLKGEAGFKDPDLQGFGDIMTLSGYLSLWRGISSPFFVPSTKLSIEYIYREPVSGWNVRINAANGSSRRQATGRTLYDNYILGYQTNESFLLKSLSSSVVFTKGLYYVNGKLNFGLNYARNSSVISQNQSTFNYTYENFSPSISASAVLWNIWGVSIDGNSGIYRYDAQGVGIDIEVTSLLKFVNTFHITKALSGTIKTDIYHSSSIGKTTMFSDIYFSWSGKRGRIFSGGIDNLFNIREYSYMILTPLLRDRFSYKIRPLTAHFGIDWRF